MDFWEMKLKVLFSLWLIRDNHPLLVVHQMDGVTRRDETELLSFQDFIKAIEMFV